MLQLIIFSKMENIANQKEYRVLFVCLGNICRSPAAEGILKDMVSKAGLSNKISVDSAGTSGYHEGSLPDERMRKHGRMRGYDFCSLSRKFRSSDFDKFDIILAMDDSNYDKIMRLSPSVEDEKKVYRMADFLQHLSADHIPDPYYSGDEGFEFVLDLLEDACTGLFNKLRNGEL